MTIWRMKHIASEERSAAIGRVRSELCALHHSPVSIDLRWEEEPSGTWVLIGESRELTLVEILSAMKALAP